MQFAGHAAFRRFPALLPFRSLWVRRHKSVCWLFGAEIHALRHSMRLGASIGRSMAGSNFRPKSCRNGAEMPTSRWRLTPTVTFSRAETTGRSWRGSGIAA